MTDKAPVIKPVNQKNYETKQSKYKNVAKLPLRQVFAAPSNSGKTTVLSNYITDIYKDCFERIYVFSPSINVDSTWMPTKEYVAKTINKKDDEPDFYYDEFNSEALMKILKTQKKIIEYQKKQKDTKRLLSILVIVDDFADDSQVCRQNRSLIELFVRGRHSHISVIVSTQKYALLSPTIRVNASQLIVFRIRNYQDLDMIINELSALFDKKTMLHIYKEATKQQFSFLYVDLSAPDINNMFMVNFTGRIQISDE